MYIFLQVSRIIFTKKKKKKERNGICIAREKILRDI